MILGRRGLLGALPSYARIAWWGLAAPRLTERGELVVHQAVVLGPDGVLLAERAELRGFELPGGEALPGESGEQAVAREVLEETGVAVRVEALVAEYRRTGFRPHRARIYRCRALSGAARPSPETPRVAWFDPARLPASLFPWCRGPLADALAGAATPLSRSEHQGVGTVLSALAIDLRARARGERG
jgi:ADP-ribose pyrophosphatase YjhB (NUDIX family)